MAGFKPKRGVTTKAGAYLLSISPQASRSPATDRYLNQGAFVEVNRALRAGKGDSIPDVVELDAAMVELPDDLLVSRRVPLSMFGDVPPQDLVGMKVRDAAYSPVSLSTVPGIADDVRMRIAVPAGTKAIVNPDTGELILDRDLEMAVTSVDQNASGGIDLHLVVLPKAGAPERPEVPDADPGDTSPEDDALRAELMKLLVPELKRRARERGLKPGRMRKSQIVDLIVADERGDDSDDSSPDETSGPATPFHHTLAGVERLADAVGQVDDSAARVSLTGGQSATTEQVTLPDGRRLVTKRGMDWGDPDDVAASIRRQADAEQLAALLGGSIGAPVPAVFRESADRVWMDWVDGQVIGATDDPKAAIASRDGQLLGLLDHLIANTDRNSGNILVRDDGSATGIDHGFAWGDDNTDVLGPVVQDAADRPASWFSRNGEWVDNPLTLRDVTSLRERLEQLRAEFDLAGRGTWLDYALAVLDQLEPHAKGTVDLIG